MSVFDNLWVRENFAVVCNRKELQAFVAKHVNQFGIPVITVRGVPRQVVWKSIGAGMYRVSTKDL